MELQPPLGAPPGKAAFGSRTLVTLKLAAKRIPAKGPIVVVVSNANGFPVSGRLSGQTAKRVAVTRRLRRVRLGPKAFNVRAAAKARVKLALPRSLRRLLARQGKLSLRLSATVHDPAGDTRTVKKAVTVRLKKQRR